MQAGSSYLFIPSVTDFLLNRKIKFNPPGEGYVY